MNEETQNDKVVVTKAENKDQRETYTRRKFMKLLSLACGASALAPFLGGDVVRRRGNRNLKLLETEDFDHLLPFYKSVIGLQETFGTEVTNRLYDDSIKHFFELTDQVARGELAQDSPQMGILRSESWGSRKSETDAVANTHAEKMAIEVNADPKIYNLDQEYIRNLVRKFKNAFPLLIIPLDGVVIRSVPMSTANYDSFAKAAILNPYNAGDKKMLPVEEIGFYSALYHESQHGLENEYKNINDFISLETYLAMITGKLSITKDILMEWLSLSYDEAMRYNHGLPLLSLLTKGSIRSSLFQDDEQTVHSWEKTFDIEPKSSNLWVSMNAVMHLVGKKLINGEAAYFDTDRKTTLAHEIMSIAFSETMHFLLSPYRSFIRDRYEATTGIDKHRQEMFSLQIKTFQSPQKRTELSLKEIQEILEINPEEIN